MQAIAVTPQHCYALYNLAVLLEEKERKIGNIQNILSDTEVAKARGNPAFQEIKYLLE